jgi:shikimate kinase
VLIGFMGTGKSSVGRQLARTTGWPCYDTDQLIATALGLPITEIFSTLGEERFRDEESAVIEALEIDRPSIVVTGGGAVLRAKNVARLRELGTVVCLTADLATLRKRLAQHGNRPLLQTENPSETFEALLRVREAFYREAADLTVDTSALTHEQVAETIQDSLALVG